MTLYFFRAETAPERAAINHFLRRHNQRPNIATVGPSGRRSSGSFAGVPSASEWPNFSLSRFTNPGCWPACRRSGRGWGLERRNPSLG